MRGGHKPLFAFISLVNFAGFAVSMIEKNPPHGLGQSVGF
ncbi:hypothetical protein P20311_2035 [Pseudoalteromonas sp. BSi20311]|nr:hypothetical protein P20311_2035 [Pseudoalteromonas sp. BSi20311]GAA70623.1 hypothetical protein P20439_0689 [Pseudoalteromonas sp. BSi20439]